MAAAKKAGRRTRNPEMGDNKESMPNNQALQVFYGTIPLILILAAIWFREQMLLTDILKRLDALETLVSQVKDQLAAVKQRLIALETRAGVIYHE